MSFFGDKIYVVFSEFFFVILSFSLCMESTSNVFPFQIDGVFLSCDHGLDFLYITKYYVIIQSINQIMVIIRYIQHAHFIPIPTCSRWCGKERRILIGP